MAAGYSGELVIDGLNSQCLNERAVEELVAAGVVFTKTNAGND